MKAALLVALPAVLLSTGCIRNHSYDGAPTTHLDGDHKAKADSPRKQTHSRVVPGETPTAMKSPSESEENDAELLRRAAHSMAFQVRLGQLMVRNSEDSALELFGQQLVIDYSQVSDAAAELAEGKGFSVSDKLNDGASQKLTRVARLYGEDFARAVLEESIRGHREAIFIHAAAAARSQDPAMRELAQRTLPMLQQHLDEALRLASKY